MSISNLQTLTEPYNPILGVVSYYNRVFPSFQHYPALMVSEALAPLQQAGITRLLAQMFRDGTIGFGVFSF
jgi:hypothetical protein